MIDTSGSPTFEVIDPNQINERDDNTGEEISKLVFTNLDVQVNQIIRKLDLNPSVWQLYYYAKNIVYEDGTRFMREEDDIGDFCSWCVRFAMKVSLGVEPGIYKHPTNLMEIALKGRNFEPDFFKR